MALDPEQRSRLLAAKLSTLVASRWPDVDPAPASFGAGSAVVDGRRTWVLVEDPTAFGIGSVLAWARQNELDEVHVIADDAGALARHATYFAPGPDVFSVDDRELRTAEPAPVPSPIDPPAEALAFVPQLEAAGLEVSIEHGVVSGEVLGLEVARVTIDANGDARLEVGVGRNDRDAFAIMHGDLPPAEALDAVATAVRKHRRADGPSHPLHRLSGERWLRAHLLTDATRLPGWQLRAVPGPVPRASVSDRMPAYAVGIDDEGRDVLVACSVGIDLDLVSQAADARAMHRPDARLVLAMPARDAHAVTRALAARLRAPAELLAIEGDWRR